MDEVAFTGEVHERGGSRREPRKSKSPRVLLRGDWNDPITEWCSVCRCWHGYRCPTAYLRQRGLPVTAKEVVQKEN
jgi:hypothetical protein